MQKLNGSVLTPLSGTAKQLVVILHGYGDSGQGIMGLGHEWREGLPDAAFVAPNAVSPCDGFPSGYQWFALRANQPVDSTTYDRAEIIKPAAEALNDYIDAQLAHWGVAENQLAVMGFSQGAMMAMYTMPRRKTACAAVLGYSGMIIDPAGLKGPDIVKPPILAIHGAMDDVVPPHSLDEVEKAFSDADFEIEAVMRKGLPHSIDAFGVMRGLSFMQENFEKALL